MFAVGCCSADLDRWIVRECAALRRGCCNIHRRGPAAVRRGGRAGEGRGGKRREGEGGRRGDRENAILVFQIPIEKTSERKNKNRVRLEHYMIFTIFTDRLKWSHGRYGHFGSRVSGKQRLNTKFENVYVQPLRKDSCFKKTRTMQSAFHNCVSNVLGVTNPNQYTNSGKYWVESQIDYY